METIEVSSELFREARHLSESYSDIFLYLVLVCGRAGVTYRCADDPSREPENMYKCRKISTGQKVHRRQKINTGPETDIG